MHVASRGKHLLSHGFPPDPESDVIENLGVSRGLPAQHAPGLRSLHTS